MVVLNLSYLEHTLIVRSQKHGWSVACICGWKWLNHAGGLGLLKDASQGEAREIWILEHMMNAIDPGFSGDLNSRLARYSA